MYKNYNCAWLPEFTSKIIKGIVLKHHIMTEELFPFVSIIMPGVYLKSFLRTVLKLRIMIDEIKDNCGTRTITPFGLLFELSAFVMFLSGA